MDATNDRRDRRLVPTPAGGGVGGCGLCAAEGGNGVERLLEILGAGESVAGDFAHHPLGQPGECAAAYVFLASPSDASYVSGTVLGVTGGKPIF